MVIGLTHFLELKPDTAPTWPEFAADCRTRHRQKEMKMKGKGTDFKTLMMIFHRERVSRLIRGIKNGKGFDEYRGPKYRCERVINKLLVLESQAKLRRGHQ